MWRLSVHLEEMAGDFGFISTSSDSRRRAKLIEAACARERYAKTHTVWLTLLCDRHLQFVICKHVEKKLMTRSYLSSVDEEHNNITFAPS